ncbi:hypothetical protein Cylst_0376 [Cylindrospermum stagnale PCC 7417]|uniref:Uncharacterized protein n=1 Tax=Cylindrospermum stagnale PCC 7417 TaxID=56107 RepID=K9WSH9_9NOST|nr:hypothetical protein [Cylindrospermum stagnale]AFZ22731.1 hypothetical protein Cylst_0376 [Cylindrospermum stagnale PCC 7417]
MITFVTENAASIVNEKLTTLAEQIKQRHPDLTLDESCLIAAKLIETLTKYLDNPFIQANVDAVAKTIRHHRHSDESGC